MLIALTSSDEYEVGQDSQLKYVETLISKVPGNHQIVLPESYDHYVELIKGFRPKKKNHLTLLRSHFDFPEIQNSVGKLRALELLLQSRGGSIYGDDPGKSSLTYSGTTENIDEIVQLATYRADRASFVGSVTKQYLGRTESDPRTVVFGFTPPLPKMSQHAELLLGGLPAESGDQMPDEWWEGVAFIKTLSPVSAPKVTDWFRDFSNFVTIGDRAHEQLETIGVSHGALSTTANLFRKKTDENAKSVGRMLRETARTEEDNREWRP